jgi:transcriptional regulator with GAF, ATPase, and Fis domain
MNRGMAPYPCRALTSALLWFPLKPADATGRPTSPRSPRRFGELDALVCDPASCGLVVVQGEASALQATARHLARRARAAERPVLRIGGLPIDEPLRELAARLTTAAPVNPAEAARAIVAHAGRAVVILDAPRSSAWGRAVFAELARWSEAAAATPLGGALVLLLRSRRRPRSPERPLDPAIDQAAAPKLERPELGRPELGRPELGRPELGRPELERLESESEDEATEVHGSPDADDASLSLPCFEVEASLSPADVRLFLEAAAQEASEKAGPAHLESLESLDAWWSAALATPSDARLPQPSLSPEAARLLARLTLAERSLSLAAARSLGAAGACEELVEKGVMTLDPRGRLVVGEADRARPAAPTEASAKIEDARAVALCLERLGDPWASARAGELHAEAGDIPRAEAALLRAFARCNDPSVREDFWRRWERSQGALPEHDAAPRLLRGAEFALRVGDVDRAVERARAAVTRGGDTFDAQLVLGQTTACRGDLVTAAIALGKALDRAVERGDAAGRARAAVLLAEVRFMAGDFEEARRRANEGLEGAPDLATRLLGRNVIGKLALSASAYAEAEAHFAADAYDAALGGDLTGELRARLNRAVALLSTGRHHEAREMLEAVLIEGERHGEVRASAFALTNLGALAMQRRDYAEALRRNEQAFELRRRIGDRLYLSLIVTNLAELRLQLGQIDEAEQALAFGRHITGPGMPASRAAHFALVAARLYLARGATSEARHEIKAALESADQSADGNKIGECHRLAARAALEDGDLTRMGTALAEARVRAGSAAARAEVALLEALRLRALGEPFQREAEEALARANEAEDPELAREAHVALVHAHAALGDDRAARSSLGAAAALRDDIAGRLPGDLRARFLARRSLAEIAALEETRAATSAETPPAGASESRARPAAERAPGPARATRSPLRGIVGQSAPVRALLHAIQKVGPSEATVLVRGESGTGKELVAEAIHAASPRRHGPLVKVNCGALVETLLLSELFGHEKGSFTGASARKRGRFEAASGGTLFLDEIGDISPRTQVALLRVLQEKTYERVGGVTPLRADVRIVCATHRDLAAMVARGEFREDLYYRLRGLVLEVPALRKRIADLPMIATALLDRIAVERGCAPKRVSRVALEALARHGWPGNVRELENALRAATLFADGEFIELSDFTRNVDGLRALAAGAELRASDDPRDSEPPRAAQPGASAMTTGSPTAVAYAHVRGGVSLGDLKRQIERDCIARALAESAGNITRAAALLGMKRPRLSQMVKQYGLGADAFGADADMEET